jgi:acetolactate synthase I/II/III large subunit
MMHIQELETIKRHALKVLFVILNDGAYGSEIQKLRLDGVDDSGAIFGRTDLVAIAKGFGLRGASITDVKDFRPLFDAYRQQDTPEVWNIHISDEVTNPSTRRQLGRGYGKM